MIIRVRCGNCGTSTMVNVKSAYRGVKCPNCSSIIQTKQDPHPGFIESHKALILGASGTIAACALLSWLLVALFSSDGTQSDGPSTSTTDGLRTQPNQVHAAGTNLNQQQAQNSGAPAPSQANASQIDQAKHQARKIAESIVKDNFGMLVEVLSTDFDVEFIDQPYFAAKPKQWACYLKVRFRQKYRDHSEHPDNHYVAMDVYFELGEPSYRWELRDIAEDTAELGLTGVAAEALGELGVEALGALADYYLGS